MQAENLMRSNGGYSPAYDEASFRAVFDKYAGVLDNNNCIHFLR